MKRILYFILLFTATAANAQVAREEIKQNPLFAASNYVAYYGPTKELTPAPKGYKPYYISHYGRHGSRYQISPMDYDMPVRILSRADSLGMLTDKGKEVLEICKVLKNESNKRLGELTQRGAEQHQQIAHRMYERFPEVFAGRTNIDAKSTVVIRCILSMENALQELCKLNPQLQIRHDASEHDMWYMNFSDSKLKELRNAGSNSEQYKEFMKRHSNADRLMTVLFNNQQYIKDNVMGGWLMDKLFDLASNIQSCESRHQMELFSLFTDEERYEQWQKSNAYWYVNYANSPLSGGVQQYSQRNLLRQMIREADSCLVMPHPGATLRYGHEVCVMPLACLLDLNGYGASIEDLEQLDDRGWNNYRIFPMGCNIQIIFYTNSRPNALPKSADVLVKVLLNEDETTLPIKPVQGCYYRWTDFRKYCLDKLDKYKE